jgi:ribosome-associated toxin RatA of RatAB toxin-antitoxin module
MQVFRPLAALLVAYAALACAAEDVSIEAERRGDAVEVSAHALIVAAPLLAWQVLTDYEQLPRFIPGMAKSVVLQRQGNRVLLEQTGEARFLVFSFPIEVRYEVTESPPESVASRVVAGNLRRMNGRYELRPAPGGGGRVDLRYRGEIEPDFDLPPLVGVAALRSMVEQQFSAMVTEIERRAAADAAK